MSRKSMSGQNGGSRYVKVGTCRHFLKFQAFFIFWQIPTGIFIFYVKWDPSSAIFFFRTPDGKPLCYSFPLLLLQFLKLKFKRERDGERKREIGRSVDTKILLCGVDMSFLVLLNLLLSTTCLPSIRQSRY